MASILSLSLCLSWKGFGVRLLWRDGTVVLVAGVSKVEDEDGAGEGDVLGLREGLGLEKRKGFLFGF